MLSCRYSGPGTVHYNRRLSSADRVVEIISHRGYESLPPLPLVPYAMSMATTVMYRALHDNERDIYTAYQDLRLCCDTLDALSQQWTSAIGVAKLAKRLWRYISSGALGEQPGSYNEHAPTGLDLSGGVVISPEISSTMVDQGRNEVASLERFPIPMPGTLQTNPALPQEQATESGNQSFQRQLIEAWPGIDTPYFQVDWAFHDLFDYRIPDVFQDP